AEGWNENVERLVKKGTLSPQDPTAARPVRTAARLVADGKITPPKRILDLCAGLGTKTLQLARAFPESHITAADIDTVKLNRLAARMKDVKQPNIDILPLAENETPAPVPETRPLKLETPPDLILVDVPCSNT